MATYRSFEDVEVWQKARVLVREIYELTNQRQFSTDYGLCNQLRRAAVSIMSNIAEGFERGGNAEFSQFLSVAKGSAGEIRAQLYVALDQRYINQDTFERTLKLAEQVGRQIGGFMGYLRTSKVRGTKYK